MKKTTGCDNVHDDRRGARSRAASESIAQQIHRLYRSGKAGAWPVGLVPDVTEARICSASRDDATRPQDTDIDRYIYLVNLLDNDATLFYRTIMLDPARFLPIVYDPTIGEACLKFGHIFRQPRGMYLSIARRGKVKEVLKNWPQKDVRSFA